MKFPPVVALALLFLLTQPWLPARGAGLWVDDYLPQLQAFLQTAETQSPRMIEALLSREFAVSEAQRRRAALYPQAGIYGTIAYSMDERADQSETLFTDKLYLNAAVRQPLYHWGAIKNADRVGRIRLALEEQNLARARRELGLEIRQRYLRLIAQKAALATETLRQEVRLEELASARKQVAEGRLTGYAATILEDARDEATLAIDQAQAALRSGFAAFKRLVADPNLRLEDVPSELPALNAEFSKRLPNEALLAEKAKERPEWIAAEKRVAAEKLNYAVERVNQRPKFGLVAGVSQDEISYSTRDTSKIQTFSTYVGIDINWSVFDFGRSKSYRRDSLHSLRRAEQARRELHATVDSDVEAARNAVLFAERALGFQQKRYNSAQGGLEGARRDLQQALVTTLYVRSMEVALREAEVALLQGRINYLVALSDLEANYGPLLPAASP